MSLQLIIGGSGSGKTRNLYENLIRVSRENPDGKHIVIVPEQFTMQTQKEIVNLHPAHGTMNIDIVSFERLAYRIFEELAVVNPTVLDDMGKSMVLRKVASMKKSDLKMFKEHLNQTGFINQLKSVISEFYQYGVKEEMLEELCKDTKSSLLKGKLTDLLTIYHGFREYTKDQFITTEEILDVLCRVLPKSEIIKNSIITLDGYTGFTPVQYRIIELMLLYAKNVSVTVTMDPALDPYREYKKHELFYMSSVMIKNLSNIAAKNNIKKEKDILCTQRPYIRYGEKAAALDVLERGVYRYKKTVFEKEQDQIHISQLLNPSKEADWILKKIRHLVRTENVKYREIAIVTGDMERYGREFEKKLSEEKIPFFIDNKKSIMSNPAAELIRSVLDLFNKDFSYESIFRYFKTGLITDETEKLDLLENYVIALGIRGYKKWNSTWEYVCKNHKDLDLTELNEFRQSMMEPLIQLRETFLTDGITIKEMTEALIGYLECVHVEEKLQRFRKAFEETGDFRRAKEYDQAYELIMELFKRIEELLGTECVSKKEYAQILDAGFEEIKVGVIPAVVDRVIIGDITRTRLDHIRFLFFAGVNDGIVPSGKESGNLLSDMDRELLSEKHIELAPTQKEDSFMQRFYLYLLLTKPSEKLYLTYALMSGDGKSLRPSSLIGEVKRIFPKLKIDYGENEKEIDSVSEAKAVLIDGLREGDTTLEDEAFTDLLAAFMEKEENAELAKELMKASEYCYTEEGISSAVAKALYGNILKGSVSRLENYAACAYAHYLAYGLELKERAVYELAAADMGNLFHNAIDLCFETVKENRKKMTELSEEEREALVHNCVLKVTEEYGNTILQSSARNAYLCKKVERITQRTLWALTKQLEKGDFEPVGFEVAFSSADNLNAMKIQLSEEEAIHLRGRIDRIDVCKNQEYVYVKIIDYKTGSKSFSLAALYYGLQLQLVVYMDAVLEMQKRKYPDSEVVPAGIFYYNINDPMVEREKDQTEEDVQAEILKQLKMNGLVNSDMEVIRHFDKEIEKESDVIPVVMKNGLLVEDKSSVTSTERFEELTQYTRNKIKETGKEILNGKISVKPYKQGNLSACDYCPYHAVCKFDLKTPGYGYKRFKKMEEDEIWNELDGRTETGH